MIEQVVNRRDDRADAEAELEPQRRCRSGGDQRQHRRPEALARQFLADDRAHDLAAGDA